jgi:ribose transport system ATP-binding protein
MDGIRSKEKQAVYLEAKHIVKTYGQTVAVNDFALEIGKGEIVGLLGGNGAGKSTLRRIISGVTIPDSGELLIEGNPVSFKEFSPLSANQLGIRVVYQELSLCTNLKVYENFYVELSGILKKKKTGGNIRRNWPKTCWMRYFLKPA